jgi:predicted GTPase
VRAAIKGKSNMNKATCKMLRTMELKLRIVWHPKEYAYMKL